MKIFTKKTNKQIKINTKMLFAVSHNYFQIISLLINFSFNRLNRERENSVE